MVKKGGDGGLIQKIADLVREKKITGISDLRDESDRSGMRLVIEVKRGEVSKAVLNQLYKRTQMQTSFGVNMVALGRRRPAHARAARADPPLRGPPARGRHPPDPARAAPGGGTGPHPRGAADRARQPRRGDRADPRLRGPGRARAGPDRPVRAVGGAGAGDPRHAPAAPDRARVGQGPRRARGAPQDDRRAASDPRRRVPHRRPDQGRARRGRRALWRRAPQRDHVRARATSTSRT